MLQRRVGALLLDELLPLHLRHHLGAELGLGEHHRFEFLGVVLLRRRQFVLQIVDELVDFLVLDRDLDGGEVLVDEGVLDQVADDLLAGHVLVLAGGNCRSAR